jgi:enoyl-CoA hydratase
MLKMARREAVVLLTLDRPEKRNALHPELIRALSAALTQAGTDTSLAVVVLTGAGSTFCAGLDLTHLASLGAEQKVDYLRLFFALFKQIYELPQPVIAAINGPAIAGGFDIAAACDLRLCSPAAMFAQTEVLLGITQILYPVYKVIGLGRAKELALTGEPITAADAQRIGLVNRVHPAESLVEQAMKLAERLASRPRQALFETKRLSREVIEVNTESALTKMFQVISERLRSDEHQREIRRYLAGLKQRH